MPTKFSGDYVVLYLSETGQDSFKLWTCCRSLTYTESSEFIEVTPTDGVQTAFLPTYQAQTISAEGLYIDAETTDPQYGSVQLFEWLRGQNKLDFRIIAGLDVYSGSCYLSNVQATGAVDQAASVSIEAVVVSVGNPSAQSEIACPTFTFSSTLTAITVSFTADTNATSYVLELYDGATLDDSTTINPPYSTPVSHTFTGLTPNKAYGFRVKIFNTVQYYERTCDTVNRSTNDVTCPTVTYTPTENSIQYSFNDGGQGVDSWAVQLREGSTLLETDTYTAPFSNPLTATFSGLSSGTTYNVTLVGTEGTYQKTCGPTNVSTNLAYEVAIVNNLSGSSISSVTAGGTQFITIVSGSFPISFGGSVYGTHDGFTNTIDVTVGGLFSNGNMVLDVNGSFIECVNFNGVSGVHSFTSRTYAAGDIIIITINEGVCN